MSDLNPQLLKGDPIPAYEVSLSVTHTESGRQTFVYGDENKTKPHVAVFYVAPRKAEGRNEPYVNIINTVSNGPKKGHGAFQLSRESAIALMKEMAKALQIKPEELT